MMTERQTRGQTNRQDDRDRQDDRETETYKYIHTNEKIKVTLSQYCCRGTVTRTDRETNRQDDRDRHDDRETDKRTDKQTG